MKKRTKVRPPDQEDQRAATLLRKKYIKLINDMHHQDARPVMNALAMLTMYIDKYAPTLLAEKLDLLRMIEAELKKAVSLHKGLQSDNDSDSL